MELLHNGDARINGDAKAYRVVIIDSDGNELMDISDAIESLMERVDVLEQAG